MVVMANNHPAQTGLVSTGSSSRLAAMRAQAQAASRPPAPSPIASPRSGDDGLLLLQQAIDQRLASVLAGLPVGKQQRLFQIRYGVSVEAIRQLPIQSILSTLAMACPQALLNSRQLPALLLLNYYGQAVLQPAR
jgi:hypothetical protein